MAAQAVSQSQQTSAQLHLSRRSEWRTVRIGGTRYVVMPSGRSGHVYTVRADGQACSCPAYQRGGYTVCSHLLALQIAAEAARPEPATTDNTAAYLAKLQDEQMRHRAMLLADGRALSEDCVYVERAELIDRLLRRVAALERPERAPRRRLAAIWPED